MTTKYRLIFGVAFSLFIWSDSAFADLIGKKKSGISISLITGLSKNEFELISGTVTPELAKTATTHGFGFQFNHLFLSSWRFRHGVNYTRHIVNTIENNNIISGHMEIPIQCGFQITDKFAILAGILGNQYLGATTGQPTVRFIGKNTLGFIGSVDYMFYQTQNFNFYVDLEYVNYLFQSPENYSRQEVRLNPIVEWRF